MQTGSSLSSPSFNKFQSSISEFYPGRKGYWFKTFINQSEQWVRHQRDIMHIFIICIFYSEMLKARVKFFKEMCICVCMCMCYVPIVKEKKKNFIWKTIKKNKFFPFLFYTSGVMIFEWVSSPFCPAYILTVIQGFQTAFLLHTTSAALHLCRSKFPFWHVFFSCLKNFL